MVRGIRQQEEAQKLGLSRRLMVRVGALLKKQVEITGAILEAAKPGTPQEALLLDAALLEKSDALDESMLRSLVDTHLKDAPASERDGWTVQREGKLRVICLAEELDAGGWDAEPIDPPPAAVKRESHTTVIGQVVPKMVPPPGHEDDNEPPPTRMAPAVTKAELAEARRAQSESEGGGEVFSRIEIDRMRIKAVASANPAERIEAMRILAHAPLPGHEKGELIFRGLTDRDPSVRVEAADLLKLLGVPDDLADTLRELIQGSPDVRVRATERLIRRLIDPQLGATVIRPREEAPEPAPSVEMSAVAACALAALKSEPTNPFCARLLDLLCSCAPVFTHNPQRVGELVRAAMAHLAKSLAPGAPAPGLDKMYPACIRLFRALGKAGHDTLEPVLRDELTKAGEPSVQAFLLQIMLELQPIPKPTNGLDKTLVMGTPPTPGQVTAIELPSDYRKLLDECAVFLGKDTTEGRDSRALGLALVPHAEPALEALVAAYPAATLGAQKFFLKLLDDIARFHPASAASRERAARIILRALESSQRSLRMSAMACRFISAPDLPSDLREQIAESFVNSLGDMGFRTDIEVGEDAVSQIGLPAINPLIKRLGQDRPADVRVQAVRTLGNLALELKPAKGEMQECVTAITELLRKLVSINAEPTFPDRRELLSAIGKLGANPAASKEAGETVVRTLLTAAQGDDEARTLEALQGLGFIAASRRAAPDLVIKVVNLFRTLLDQDHSQISTETKNQDGEIVIEIKNENQLIEALPDALQGLSRIARSRNCPAGVLRELVDLLAKRAGQVFAGNIVWGPANALFLIRALQEIGCHAAVDDRMLMVILKALAPRLSHPPALQAVSAILATRDSATSSAAALTVGMAIVNRRRADGRFESEDRSDILKALGRIVARKHLGLSDPVSQEKTARFRDSCIDELFKGAQDLVPGAYEGLTHLREARVLPAAVQAALERRLNEFHGLALVLPT